jgi:hypothetical protein
MEYILLCIYNIYLMTVDTANNWGISSMNTTDIGINLTCL